MRGREILLLLASAALLGCGDGGTGPEPADIAGTWSFEAHDLTAPGATGVCSFTGELHLDQSGASVTGDYRVDRITCTGPNGGTYEGPFYGAIVSGTVSGNKVHFHFDDEAYDQHGTVSADGNSMSGTCTWRLEVNGYATMTGNWSATR